MNVNLLKGYVLVVLSGLILLAAALLVILQWGNQAKLSLYGKNVEVNTFALVLCSAAGGIVIVFLCWVFVRGLRSLLKGRRKEKQQLIAQRISNLEQHKQKQQNG